MAAFTIASLGLMGIPPLAGFVSKWALPPPRWKPEYHGLCRCGGFDRFGAVDRCI
ncbi:MAG: hypothetical protein ACLT0Y_05745 [Christensenellales bacterium]